MADLNASIETLRHQEQELLRQITAVRGAIRSLSTAAQRTSSVPDALEAIVSEHPGLTRRDLLDRLKSQGVQTTPGYLKLLLVRRKDLFRRENGKVFLK